MGSRHMTMSHTEYRRMWQCNNDSTFLPMADVRDHVCSWVITGQRIQKGLTNRKEAQKAPLLCWLSALLFLLHDGCNDWIWFFIKSESLWFFHVASGWMGKKCKLNKAFFSLNDWRTSGLSHAFFMHSFSWHNFSCSLSLSGFLCKWSHSPSYLCRHLYNICI